MPANLPPAYHEAERRFRAAREPQEKVAALEEMLRLIPKHKGTEKLQGSIKSRIAKLKRQPPKAKGGAKGRSHQIPREGAAQVALVGPPNAGKSALVDRLTHATPEVADYPFTTREALPGMMAFEDIAFQLVDLPPLSEEYVEPWVWDLIRGADLLWVVVDHASSLDGLELARTLLGARRIEAAPAGGEPREERGLGWVHKPALLVVTGADQPECGEDLQILRELIEEDWPMVAVSSIGGQGLDTLKRMTFEVLQLIRVYTKKPHHPPDREQPFTLPRGATVADLAAAIHKELVGQLKFARIWGPSAFDGQTVQGEHVLAEGDIVELHL